jgi:hypothetical protein
MELQSLIPWKKQHFFLCFKKEYQIPTRSQLGASGNFRGKV